jgi:phenylacetic acid degradation operon negative regulatory protein
MKGVDCEEIFDALGWLFDKMSRPTLGNWLAGYAGYHHRDSARRVVGRMEQEGWVLSKRSGRRLEFQITDKGRARLREGDPAQGWQQAWDGDWRAITFDVPEKKRKDRKALWKALRARKLGFLQQSIWIWPHELEPIVRDIIKVEGLPECFFGFTTRHIWLCQDSEVVAGSWDWAEIQRRHRAYLRQTTVRLRAAQSAASLEALAQVARMEWAAYRVAFLLDPFLPRQLLPPEYDGQAVQEQHKDFRQWLVRRAFELSPADA